MLSRTLSAIAALGIFVAGPRQSARAEPPIDAAEELARAVDAYLAPLVEAGLFSGTILLACGPDLRVEKAYGQADIAGRVPNAMATRFKLMSVTKSITAVAVLRLVQAGKLTIEDPVAKHLPGWPKGWESVTVRHLLDHTAGIANLEGEWVAATAPGVGRGLATWRRLAPKLAAHTLEAPAGSRHSYSNFQYVLLGAITEVVSGQDYSALVKAEVFVPAGMEGACLDDGTAKSQLALGYFLGKGGIPDPRGQDMSVIEAAGGIVATAQDLYHLDRALRDDTLLSAATKERMLTAVPHAYDYALGWQVRPVHGRPCVRHSGGANGYVADFLRFPDDDACVVVLSNFAFVPSVLLGEELAGVLLGRDVDVPRKLTRPALDACSGCYRGDGSTLLVRRSGGFLVAYDLPDGATRTAAMPLVATGDHRFRRQAWPTRLHLVVEDGRACALELFGQSTLTLPRVEDPASDWQAAAGSYRQQGGPASTYRIAAAKGRLELRVPSGWGADLEILPLTDTLALTLYGEDYGTVLALERDGKAGVRGFRWTRNDGQVVVCHRAGS